MFRTGHDIKSGGDADDVELMFSTIFEFDTLLGELRNGVVLDVNQFNILTIELLVVVEFKARTLDTKGVGWVQRCHEISSSRVTNSVTHVLGPEVVRFSIGLWVKKVVFVVTEPESEAAIGPQLAIEGFSFGWRVFESALLREGIQESAETFLAETEKLRVHGFLFVLFFCCEGLLPHRHS